MSATAQRHLLPQRNFAPGTPGALVLDWLRRIHEATQKLSYTGTFVYQQGGRTETSRITRFVDARV